MRPEDVTEFDSFYRAHRDDIYRAVLVATRDDRAEDSVAEAFARAAERWPMLRSHPDPVAWTVRVALNHFRSAWRIWRREAPPSLEPPEATTAGSVDPYLVALVWRLPERQRQVVALRILLDLDTRETGRLLGIAEGTVKVHLHRALQTLRESLERTEQLEASGG